MIRELTTQPVQKARRKNMDMLSTSGWLRITAATGLEIPYLGYLELEVETIGMTLPECGFLVAKEKRNVTVPSLIGLNIVSHCRQLVHADLMEL